MKKNKILYTKSAVISGIIASLSLIAIYSVTLSLLSTPAYAYQQLISKWYLFGPLTISVGIQFGLVRVIKNKQNVKDRSLQMKLSSSSGVSVVSMLICCTHYLVGFIPYLGVATFALTLADYQNEFLMVSIFINLLLIVNLVIRIRKLALVDQI